VAINTSDIDLQKSSTPSKPISGTPLLAERAAPEIYVASNPYYLIILATRPL